MPTLKVLHLSDLHWSENRKGDMRIVIDGLVEDLSSLRRKHSIQPDIVVFSGDLVLAGEDSESFSKAHKAFIEPILIGLNLPDDRFFIVPGNHDIERKTARDATYIEAGLSSSLTTPDRINSFIDGVVSGNASARPALSRMANYEKFFLSLKNRNIVNNRPLVKTYLLTVDSLRVGIACFNTAWRATGEENDVDLRKMILGERNIDLALDDLKSADFRLAVYHHPFEWLSTADEASVTSRLFSQFDLLMCGHIHRASPEARVVSTGSAVLSQSGCLFESRRYFNGYQIVTVDTQAATAHFDIRTWFDAPRRAFDTAGNVADAGSVTLQLTSARQPNAQNGIEPFLREVRLIVRDSASQHINITESSTAKLGAKEAFICPPLAHGQRELAAVPPADAHAADAQKSENLSGEESEDEEDDRNDITAEEILRKPDNILITGTREAGKTSLAHYLAVLVTEGVTDLTRIPILIDYRVFKANIYGIQRAIASYVGTTEVGLDVKSAMKSGSFLFLVDNFSGQQVEKKVSFVALMEEYPQNRWIMLSDSRMGGTDPERNDSNLTPNVAVFRIRDLPRRSIRELTVRWCSKSGGDSNRVFAAIMTHLKAGNLPKNGYIVTLLLWAVYQEQRFERINEALLLTNIIDHLLGKADFTKSLEREFDPAAKEITLQFLAKFMRNEGGIASKNDVTSFLIDFFTTKGLRHVASDVLKGLIDCGILFENDDGVTFKYRVFQDYFLAQLLRSNTDELARILDGFEYHRFAREIELLSGLRRQNSDLIQYIGKQLRDCCPPQISDYGPSDFVDTAHGSRITSLPFRQIADIRENRLTASEIDDMMDAADRRMSNRRSPKQGSAETGVRQASRVSAQTETADATPEDRNTMSPSVFMTSLALLGRVIRNSEFTDAKEKTEALRQYLGMQRDFFSFYSNVLESVIVDMIVKRRRDDETDVKREREDEVVSYIFRRVFLVSIMDQCFKEVGTEKLANIYNEICEDKEVDTFASIAMAFFAFDLSEKNWIKKWRALIEKNKKHDFTIDVLVDKIWSTLFTRYIPPAEMVEIERIANDLETALGRPRVAKGRVLEKMRETVKETNEKLDKGVS